MEQLRYPVGRFAFEGMTATQKDKWIQEMDSLPEQLRAAVKGLTDEQLDTPYRTEGWTIRQVVHHVADSAANSFSRFKLALTEPNPTIKPFNEEEWALTVDSLAAAPEPSLQIVDGIYARWTMLLRAMERSDFERQFYHPEKGRQVKLSDFLGYSVWHGRHHVAHITALRERMNW